MKNNRGYKRIIWPSDIRIVYAELLYGLEIDFELKTIFIRILSEIVFLFKKKAHSIFIFFDRAVVWDNTCTGCCSEPP